MKASFIFRDCMRYPETGLSSLRHRSLIELVRRRIFILQLLRLYCAKAMHGHSDGQERNMSV